MAATSSWPSSAGSRSGFQLSLVTNSFGLIFGASTVYLALKAGLTVLADRYCYTAFARDVARGVDRQWVRDLYGFAVKPDLALYFRVPIEVSLDRLMARRRKRQTRSLGRDTSI